MITIRRRHWQIALMAAVCAVLALAGWTVRQHERTLSQGQIVYRQLNAADPRALMQGDYMALRYTEEESLAITLYYARDPLMPAANMPQFAYFRLDTRRRATLVGWGETSQVAAGLLALRIRYRNGQPTLGPNAFFFQEGTADRYAAAAWAMLRVAPDGDALLVALTDEDLKPLGYNHF
ncbi:GDYXXLXY domain-containing protein [Lampropedia cohaerens]|uniref:GDYXXLXY domain-containing protein n=1 Tax=Lampropedia cohaerens TaxID=1610491 RepID=UPI000699A382|nr:GDYXXLXY domain-containing protein [Lampropedia cohaerens]